MTESIAISLLVGYLRGGRFEKLARISIKGITFILLALIFRNGANYLAGKGNNIIIKYNLTIQIMAYLLLFSAIYLNRKLYGFKVLGLGTFLNFLVIIANKGQMPVWSKVLSRDKIDLLKAGHSTMHTLLTSSTKLSFLGDIIYIPPPYPMAQLISLGDIVISIGIFLLIQKAMIDNKPKPFKFTQFNRNFYG